MTVMRFHNLFYLNLYQFIEEDVTVSPIRVPEFIPMFDLTTLPSVKELSKDSVDPSSDPINIPDGLIIGDEVVTTAYVSRVC